MKIKWKQTISITAAAMLLLTAAGCGKDAKVSVTHSVVEDSNVTEPGVLPIVKDPITLKVGVFSDSNIEDYATNAYTKFLEEKTGINMDFDVIINPGTKLKVMLASNDELPEVLFQPDLTDDVLMKYGKNGTNTILDLNDYIDTQSYWYNEAMAELNNPKVEKSMYTADGARYGMPKICVQTGNQYGVKAFINKKWLDKLGLEIPKTTEELEKVLTAFKTQDPNGNGKADEIGITGATNSWKSIPWHFFVNSFIYDDYDTQLIVNDDDKIESIYDKQEFKDALTYINKLYNEGLYDEESFSQNESTLRTIAMQDDNTIGLFVGGSPDAIWRSNPERMLDYVALPPLEGPNGVAWAVRGEITAGKRGFITKYCDHPLAAYRLMDYMMSEEASIFSRYGVEGTDWRPADENDIGLFESIGAKATIVSILPYGTKQNSHWQERNVCYRSAAYSDGMAWSGDPYDGEKFKADALPAYYGKAPEKVYVKAYSQWTEEEMEDMSFLEAEIKQHIDSEIPKFILGRRPLSEYDKFIEEINNMGYQKYLDIVQSGYDRGAKD